MELFDVLFETAWLLRGNCVIPQLAALAMNALEHQDVPVAVRYYAANDVAGRNDAMSVVHPDQRELVMPVTIFSLEFIDEWTKRSGVFVLTNGSPLPRNLGLQVIDTHFDAFPLKPHPVRAASVTARVLRQHDDPHQLGRLVADTDRDGYPVASPDKLRPLLAAELLESVDLQEQFAAYSEGYRHQRQIRLTRR